MNRLIVSVLATAALAAGGAAVAQGGDAESQAGSAWRGTPNYGPYAYPVPNQQVPSPEVQRGFGPAPDQVYGNSGWTPPNGYVYRGTDRYGRPLYSAQAPSYGYILNDRASRRDRDGDGVPNRRDRFPDDYRRW
ncbi:hypothetical protein [Ramlibacter sp.]|uniref:hypothetical protein n=1 Tax=Ramlibacter sp. TaxID=1917967 RepID=UPI002BAC058E|nr:hypothetical protein [Ramlibacter sp.]HWI82574.1 hypothetical protein [Ramlibacter sp.]